MPTHDWWVYRKTAKVAHAVPLKGTPMDVAGHRCIHNGTAACGTVLWIYASPAAADVKRCPKCVKAIEGGAVVEPEKCTCDSCHSSDCYACKVCQKQKTKGGGDGAA